MLMELMETLAFWKKEPKELVRICLLTVLKLLQSSYVCNGWTNLLFNLVLKNDWLARELALLYGNVELPTWLYWMINAWTILVIRNGSIIGRYVLKPVKLSSRNVIVSGSQSSIKVAMTL